MVHLFASNIGVRFWLSDSIRCDALDWHFEARNEAILKLSFTFCSVKKVF